MCEDLREEVWDKNQQSYKLVLLVTTTMLTPGGSQLKAKTVLPNRTGMVRILLNFMTGDVLRFQATKE